MQGTNLIARLLAACARRPATTIVTVLALGAWGALSLMRAPLDAIPDLSDTQVILVSDWPGRSPGLVEDQITYPLSTSLLAAPKVKFVRGQSFFGVSFVYVIFEDGTDIYWARSRVLEYVNTAGDSLPEGVRPRLGPDATGVGWVFQYALVDRSGGHDLQELRALQDWNLRYALESVEGVAEVAAVGGFIKEYQIVLDPVRLQAQSLGIAAVVRAVREANEEVGGRTIEIAEHEHMIRGRGYVKDLDDLRATPVDVGPDGIPIRLGDVAEIGIGPAPRRGIAELDGEGEAVGGIVIMRYGENALRVIERVKGRLEELKPGLPSGVEVAVTYDRSELINASIDTLKHTLVEEMAVVSIVIFLFLAHVRSAVVPILTLPLAVLLAFIPMFYQSLTANIMSLGGIVVAIGAMVDASIIIIENIHTHLSAWDERGRQESRFEVTVRAMQEVGPSIFFSLLVITVSFLPVFTLQGVEGRLFRPLAFTKTYSMGFAAVLAVTLTPALAALLVRGKILREEDNVLNRWLVRLYTPVVRFVVRHRIAVVALSVLIVLATVPAFRQLGSEFMPPLNEGAILYMPTAPPGMSVTEASRVLQTMDRRLKAFPEVVSVLGKMGRANTATDPAPIGMAETTVVLKPKSEWRPGLTWDALVEEMDAALTFPGMPNIWWMPIQTRTEMLATGVRSPLGIQVFGDDLAVIERTAVAIEQAVGTVPGTRSAFAERSTGGFFLDVEIDREKAARYGLRAHDINEVVMTAVGGMHVSEVVAGRARFPVSVRYGREFRDRPDLLGEVLVQSKSGASIPLRQVADIRAETGPPMVRTEDGKLVAFVFVDTSRPIADYVEDARRVIEAKVALPAGTRLGFVGQFKYLQRAKERLQVVLPITLLLITLLLYWNTGSLAETGIVLLAVPFSLVGAVWLLWLLDYNMSVAVWVGIIALAGLDAETGVIMLLYLTLSHRRWQASGRLRDGADLEEAIVDGAARRVRPKLMTVITTMVGLLPVLWSTGTGADMMKRVAAPMVGGLTTSFLLELTVYPAIFALWKGRSSSSGTTT
jgi:Cu(I)/Ag(I) efflux system membrane protein CusA/SilA